MAAWVQRRATQLPALQGSISTQQLDLADLASVRAAAAELQRLPRIDYMILNAGVMVGAPSTGGSHLVLPVLPHEDDALCNNIGWMIAQHVQCRDQGCAGIILGAFAGNKALVHQRWF